MKCFWKKFETYFLAFYAAMAIEITIIGIVYIFL